VEVDEETHYIYTFQWHRIVAHSARVRGWTITLSHFLNNQLVAGRVAGRWSAAMTIVLPYSRRTRVVIDPGRKETSMGTNESKTVHRVGWRFDARP
jgi:hypothetical protein